MKRIVIGASILALVALAMLSMGTAPATSHSATSAASTCLEKHCSPNTHCCYGCSGNPICVKNGVHCPECAPQ